MPAAVDEYGNIGFKRGRIGVNGNTRISPHETGIPAVKPKIRIKIPASPEQDIKIPYAPPIGSSLNVSHSNSFGKFMN